MHVIRKLTEGTQKTTLISRGTLHIITPLIINSRHNPHDDLLHHHPPHQHPPSIHNNFHNRSKTKAIEKWKRYLSYENYANTLDHPQCSNYMLIKFK